MWEYKVFHYYVNIVFDSTSGYFGESQLVSLGESQRVKVSEVLLVKQPLSKI